MQLFFSAKFDPPLIVKILAGSTCLEVNWNLSQQQTWMNNFKLNLEIRLRVADSDQWTEQLVSTRPYNHDLLSEASNGVRSDLLLFALENRLDFPSPGSTNQICKTVFPPRWN